MNFVEEDEFNLTEDLRNIERRFCRSYLKIIKDYFDLDPIFVWTAKDISNLETFKKKKHYVINKAHELLLLCIQDTCLSLRKFYYLLMKYKEIAEYLSKKNPVVMYCVVGESFLAALGISIVIDEAVDKYGLSDKTDRKQIQLIVTDKYLKWKTICFYIVERLNSCYKNIEIKLEFVEENSFRLSGNVCRRVKDADIVVMSRYLSRFQFVAEKPYFLEFVLKRMKELSILFYLDACQKEYQDAVKNVFTKMHSLIEIRNKKTAFQSLEDPRNGDYFSEFPFLYNTTFEKVAYSISIKYFAVSCNKSEEKYTKKDLLLLKHSRKQVKRKILERFAKESSQVRTPKIETLEARKAVGKSEIETLEARKVVGKSQIEALEGRKVVGKSQIETLEARKVVGKSEAANLQNINKYKCPHLATEKSITHYATSLSEIYYSQYFDKEVPCSPKMKLYKQLRK